MASVENRIVKMEFDNAAFERKLHQTIESLGQLNKALKLDGAKKGLQDVGKEAGRLNLNPINTAVQSVSAGFLSLSTIAVTALATITHAAITTGARVANAFTLQPLIEGFSEYETQLNSVQTILANTASKGTSLDQVSEALQQLNIYSDKTIYNFGQMARNIGTFTAAGVGLDESVLAIKGIANLAALSGSSSEQASAAMYQLSQAMASGTLKAQDWISVVNSGMGGEVFQTALFDTARALGTLSSVPVGQSFEEWKDAGGNFKELMSEGVFTAEVLSTALQAFTGDLTEADLVAQGFTQEQAKAMVKTAQIAVDAATEVKTFTQLMGTVKEAVATGWSDTFKILIGDFEEAKQLWTRVNNAVSGFIQDTSSARNEVLQEWKDLGGRTLLIQTLASAFKSLGSILKPIRNAFRDVFPPVTAERLLALTKSFAEFVRGLKPSETTINNIKRIFTGLFSALDIGWEIIKAGAGFIKDLVVQLTGLGSGNILEFTADIADFFTRLREGLGEGEAIHNFFDRLTEEIQKPIEFIGELKDAIFEFFGIFSEGTADAAGDAVDRFGDRMDHLQGLGERLGRLFEPIKSFFEGLLQVLDVVGEAIGDWFQELGDKLAEAFEPGEFDAILDALNVSLLGGIALILGKFLRGGINLDFGGGVFGNIADSFQELTGVLTAMQTSIKADALLKIAGAIALLTASVLVLSLIDSAALTKALTAMAVGFGQLMGAFALLNAMSLSLTGGASFSIVATGMILMATAILILSGAVAILAQLSWGELARGLAAITAILTVLTGSALILAGNAGGILLGSVAMIAMATAITILAGAVALFANMEWNELIRGFAGVAAGLLIMAAAAHLFPPNMVLQAGALILVATALNILFFAVENFSSMDWGEMGKGFVGVGAGLLIIAAAMHLMPANMLLSAAGLVVVSGALLILGQAIQSFGGMSWSEIGKGLLVLAGALLILAIATNAMTGALAGAAAILVVSVAMGVLAKVLIELAKVPFGDLLKALGAIAIALTIFGVAAALIAPILPALLGLGVAMVLLGAAFALFGIGALAVAKAFELLARAGPDAADALIASMTAIGAALPMLLAGFAEGVIEIIRVFVEAAPEIAKGLGVLLEHILQTLVEIIPKVGEVFKALIDVAVDILSEKGPDLIAAGLEFLLNFLNGISDNIGEIVDVVSEIIVEFLNGIQDNIEDITTAGTNLLIAFLAAITDDVTRIAEAAGMLIRAFVAAIIGLHQDVINAGFNVLLAFISGISSNLVRVTDAVGTMIATFIRGVGAQATKIATAGTNTLIKFLSGIANNLGRVITAVTNVITTFINSVTANANRVVTSGANAIISFVKGLGQNANRIVTAGVTVIIQFLRGVASNAIRLARGAADVLITFLNGLADAIREKAPELRQAGRNIASAILEGLSGGLSSKAGTVIEEFKNTVQSGVDSVTSFLGINSPSKLFVEIGQSVGEGFALGLSDTTAVEREATSMADTAVVSFKKMSERIAEEMASVSDHSPTITPVLDLTKVRKDLVRFKGSLSEVDSFTPSLSVSHARAIATTSTPTEPVAAASETPRDIKFEQNIYAPEQLSTGDIYKQTRNQIAIAKEELNVP